MRREPVEHSPDVVSMGYDAVSRLLEVEYANTDILQYYGVPQQVFNELQLVRDKGRFSKQEIENKHVSQRLK